MASVTKSLLPPFLLLALVAVLSCLINSTADYSACKIIVQFFLTLLACIGLRIVIGTDISLDDFVALLVAAVDLQMIISVCFFVAPSVETALSSIIEMDSLFSDAVDSYNFRLHGLGVGFFGASVQNALTLLLIAINCRKKKTFYLISYIIITFVGIFMGRTVLVGVLVSLPIMIYNFADRSLVLSLFSSFLIFGLLYIVFVYIKNSNNYQLSGLFDFGFELFNNYEKYGTLYTTSSAGMLDLSLLDNFDNMLIGDGLFVNPLDKNYYYKDVDNGYLRSILYYGFLGLFLFLIGIFKIVKIIAQNNGRIYFFLLPLFLILFYKGYITIFEVFLPLIVFSGAFLQFGQIQHNKQQSKQ